MRVTIQAAFKKELVQKQVDAFVARVEAAVLLRFQLIGEQFIINARTGANFKDQTGALRSSISYVIIKDGKAYYNGGFVQVKDGSKGVAKGKNFLAEIVKQYPTGWVLVGFAGESYAAAVEAKGFDVITGASLLAKEAMNSAVKKIKNLA